MVDLLQSKSENVEENEPPVKNAFKFDIDRSLLCKFPMLSSDVDKGKMTKSMGQLVHFSSVLMLTQNPRSYTFKKSDYDIVCQKVSTLFKEKVFDDEDIFVDFKKKLGKKNQNDKKKTDEEILQLRKKRRLKEKEVVEEKVKVKRVTR